jgi:hypothetical protein
MYIIICENYLSVYRLKVIILKTIYAIRFYIGTGIRKYDFFLYVFDSIIY